MPTSQSEVEGIDRDFTNAGFLSGNVPKPEDLPAGDYRKGEQRFSKEHYDKVQAYLRSVV